ncbi:bifunctional diaminohydroxyphosphoribosylaminopyrimidine deaminase/5-amino-6-(5-phosphoribosylamino)uracil reductase RibD [Clavibacter sp. VKM Ac-2872]|uniref:bifunctional diaminohydroxyphosphoribosylaminopyrimidine deaminase/5-amino-6-(5-phosphoribosylamino)uracil reductase RibD n=1 Tax=Clavibacter sp. VKM Ac-2872 TaxID=2783812 RepID=UPI00188AA856|nr:bifunctional diaminohydroxyphosphoribosylaminopyrimidine deaminase/5-amino-6-(5-phosphoribosylamino)uracil reductase RibD [Clavibacter sp. VKM Ac-2872]MBF4623548.1 bifunctional diaminohydroxyphosphoribosylaminopyrimidine deaminase/5-amino-6-(5-phosphoribosylamino)uracil reductase RibD [Clavibacter sp. VKM Ac-2872]
MHDDPTAPRAQADAPAQADALERAMRRGLELAAEGPAWGPNPRVGCVILDARGRVLAEGRHRGAGSAHAEVDALRQLPAGAARGSTAVVTLEPCNHPGRTGPCAAALIEAGVTRVAYAVPDPGAESSGGAARLRAAGVEVVPGVLADEAAAFLRVWLGSASLGRPFVTAKWASSLDGRIAAADGTSRWITGPAAREDVHRRRAEADAILVGTGTVLADDPALTARRPDGIPYPHQPAPVVLGDRPIPDDAAVRRHPRRLIRIAGHDPAAALDELGRRGIRHVFVEGGPTIVSALVAAGLVDEVVAYLAPVLLGGPRTATGDLGVPSMPAAHRLTLISTTRLGDDLLVIARPTTEGQ